MIKSFASDNNSGVHPDVLTSINEANNSHFVSYGNDIYTAQALEEFEKVFGKESRTFFVLTGTGANVTALQSFTNRYQAVICTETAHINVDECGAPEHALGAKLLPVRTNAGKLLPEQIDEFIHFKGDQHHVQPKVVSITQATELGTVYSINELKTIVEKAHKNNLIVHMDGARIANAAVFLNCSLGDITTEIGIDVLSFGGTKNGLMLGEAVVFFNKKDTEFYPFIRKQNMQLVSKMRFISAQFIPYFKNDLWRKNAKQANDMALYLFKKIQSFRSDLVLSEPQANALFVKLPKDIAKKMQSERFFYTWDEIKGIYRFMTSYDMSYKDIDDFVTFLQKQMLVA